MVAKIVTWRGKWDLSNADESPRINVLSELWDNQIPDPALFWRRNIDLDFLCCTGLEFVSASSRKAILLMSNPSLYIHIFPRSFCFSVFAWLFLKDQLWLTKVVTNECQSTFSTLFKHVSNSKWKNPKTSLVVWEESPFLWRLLLNSAAVRYLDREF